MKASNHHPTSVKKSNWDGIAVKYCYMTETGDFDLAMSKQSLSVAFAPQDRATWSVDARTSQTTPVVSGNILLCSNHNIEVGYANKSHFTTQFRKYVGMTPAAYRNNI